jgi:hypothetical protein
LINIISLILSLLATTLEAAKVGGAAPEVIQAIESAIASLQKVQGSDVTYAQLEGLRIKPQW